MYATTRPHAKQQRKRPAGSGNGAQAAQQDRFMLQKAALGFAISGN
jgi:hypothetical protein